MEAVKIGRKKYKVEFVHSFTNNRRMGEIDYDARTITLGTHLGKRGRKLTDNEFVETFWHEVIHASLDDMRSDMTYDEKFVTGLAKRIVSVMRQPRNDDENYMVSQCAQRLRKLRKKVP